MKRFMLLLSLSLVIVSCISFIPTKSAFAAGGVNRSGHARKGAVKASPYAATDCFYSPSDQTCDNVDPNDASCSSNAGYPKTVATLPLSVAYFVGGSDNQTAVLIQLRYSATCKSNWTHAYSYTSIWDGATQNMYDFYIAGVNIVRDDGLNYPYYPGDSMTEAWTNMVYAPVKKAKACIQYGYTYTHGSGGGGGGSTDWYCTAFY